MTLADVRPHTHTHSKRIASFRQLHIADTVREQEAERCWTYHGHSCSRAGFASRLFTTTEAADTVRSKSRVELCVMDTRTHTHTHIEREREKEYVREGDISRTPQNTQEARGTASQRVADTGSENRAGALTHKQD